MEEALYKKIFMHQKKHWFFAAKRCFFDVFLGKGIKRDGSLSVADVGCGTGALFSYLRKFGSVVGLDISALALSYALESSKENDVGLLQAKADEIPLKDNVFDMACLSDVLYHKNVYSDRRVLSECFRILRPGGILILSDSAFKILKSRHDDAAHGSRRYSKLDIRAKLEGNGFSVGRISYTYMSLFLIVLIVRFLKKTLLRNKKDARMEFNSLPYILNIVLKVIFFCEAQLLHFISFPFGISVMAVAIKE